MSQNLGSLPRPCHTMSHFVDPLSPLTCDVICGWPLTYCITDLTLQDFCSGRHLDVFWKFRFQYPTALSETIWRSLMLTTHLLWIYSDNHNLIYLSEIAFYHSSASNLNSFIFIQGPVLIRVLLQKDNIHFKETDLSIGLPVIVTQVRHLRYGLLVPI